MGEMPQFGSGAGAWCGHMWSAPACSRSCYESPGGDQQLARGLLQLGHVDIDHLQHRLRRGLRHRGVGIAAEPGKAER